MLSSIHNSKLQKGSQTSCSNINDDLLSLLIRPRFGLEATSSSSSQPKLQRLLPSSFDDAFDDPYMEPLPLGPQAQLSGSIYMRGNHCATSFSEHTWQNDLYHNIQGSKRSPDDHLFSSHDEPTRKRHRTTPVQAASDEELVTRFRPYQETQWQAQFHELVQYKQKNGHCCVPHAYPDDPILARWVKRQRYQYKKLKTNDSSSTMTSRRIQELESIGFVWDSHAAAWQEKLNELVAFKQGTGHCNVPSHYPANPALSSWVKCQRRQFKLLISGRASSRMTMERLQALHALGFVFYLSRRKEGQRAYLNSRI